MALEDVKDIDCSLNKSLNEVMESSELNSRKLNHLFLSSHDKS